MPILLRIQPQRQSKPRFDIIIYGVGSVGPAGLVVWFLTLATSIG